MAAASASGGRSGKEKSGGGGDLSLVILADPTYDKLLKEGFDEDKILRGRIKTLNSRTYRVSLPPTATVRQLKQTLEDREAVRVGIQHFRFSRKEWKSEDDTLTLAEAMGLTAAPAPGKSVPQPSDKGEYTLLLLIRDGVERLKALSGITPTAPGSVQSAPKPIRSETMVIQKEDNDSKTNKPHFTIDNKQFVAPTDAATAVAGGTISNQTASSDANAAVTSPVSVNASDGDSKATASVSTAGVKKPIPIPVPTHPGGGGGGSATQAAERDKRLKATLARLSKK